MRPETTKIARLLRSRTDEARVRVLQNAYAGETAYFISCGPSLADVWNEALAEFLQDKLVIAIKNAYDLRPDMVDMHIFNAGRYTPLTYKHPDTLRFVIEHRHLASAGSRLPIPYPYRSGNAVSALAVVSKQFEYWELQRSLRRPWGPGVMLELGVFLPIFLGCTRAIVFGWDMSLTEPVFYHSDKPFGITEEYAITCNAWPSFIPYLQRWYDAKGVEIFLCSPRSSIPLPQLTQAEVLAEDYTRARQSRPAPSVSVPTDEEKIRLLTAELTQKEQEFAYRHQLLLEKVESLQHALNAITSSRAFAITEFLWSMRKNYVPG